MGSTTGISWTDSTWNPIRGCSVVSPGCTNCYAMELAARFSGPGLAYEGLAGRTPKGHSHWTGKLMFVERHIGDPLTWGRWLPGTPDERPRRIFVNSMSDLFHEDMPKAWIDRVFEVMERTPRHRYQILTKRPAIMRDYMIERAHRMAVAWGFGDFARDSLLHWYVSRHASHIWLGTSVEDQERALERIPLLLETPAAVRFLSCEPLLGPLDLSTFLWDIVPVDITQGTGEVVAGSARIPSRRLHWIIAGGESGRGFRFGHGYLDAARSIRDQCLIGDVPFFHKQAPGLKPGRGEELDGRLWHQFPQTLSPPYGEDVDAQVSAVHSRLHIPASTRK